MLEKEFLRGFFLFVFYQHLKSLSTQVLMNVLSVDKVFSKGVFRVQNSSIDFYIPSFF